MSSRRSLSAFAVVLVLSLLLSPAEVAGAAAGTFRAQIDTLDNSRFPQVDAYVSVSSATGEPIKNLNADAFSISEDGVLIASPTVQALQNLEQPLGIALLIDVSSNYKSQDAPDRLQKSVEAAKAFVEQLTPLDQLTVIKYSDSAEVVLPLTADKKAAGEALDRLKLEATTTAMYDAIYEGVKALKSLSGRRMIMLIGDGKDTGSRTFGTEATQKAEEAFVSIYSMGFGNVIGIQTLQKMAALTAGSAYIDKAVFELKPLLTAALLNLREQYQVRYVSNLPANNTEHEVLVTVRYQGGQQQVSQRFVAKTGRIPITLPSLQEGQTVGGFVDFAPVVDWAPLKTLDILVDGTAIANLTAPPFEFKWKSTDAKLAPGSHAFTLKASDAAGNTGETTINLDVQPPISIKITNPSVGTTIRGGTAISADIAGLGGISVQRVEFLVDENVIATLTAPPYSAVWTGPTGTHVIAVRAYDGAGLFTTTEAMTVLVQPGFPWWMVGAVALVLAALIVPLAMRSRRRAGTIRPATVAAGQPLLREMEGMSPGQVWPLGSSIVRLGRKRAENDIPLKGLNASRRHASISLEQGQYVITSLSPQNPVLVNNVPISQSQALQTGDLIRLGETTLRFER